MASFEQHSAFEVENLNWQVSGTPILKSLNFSVCPGEFVGIIGPNGAGKSSLLRCLYKKITDFDGSILYFNKAIHSINQNEFAKTCAVVLQEPPSDFTFLVSDVIAMGLIPHQSLLSLTSKQELKKIESAAEKVDIAHKLNQEFTSLSGGEKQRVMIARAIVQQPKILLMDEPTNHLDIKHQIEVLHLAKSMGITVMVSIHDLNLAAAFCDRLLLLNEGELIANGSPQDVLSQTNLYEVFGVNAQIDQAPFADNLRITFDTQIASKLNGTDHE